MIDIYQSLSFPTPQNRPYFISDFVSTIDGKVAVKKEGYWPIGSKVDYEVFTFIRAHADAIIDGKHTALKFSHALFDTIHKPEFRQLRTKLEKDNPPEYIVMTSQKDETLTKALENKHQYPSTIYTESISSLVSYLHKKDYHTVFVDGGPTLISSFLQEKLLDELFLTISPKIFGSEKDITLTLAEGYLFPPEAIPLGKLISSHVYEDEVFLRYKLYSE